MYQDTLLNDNSNLWLNQPKLPKLFKKSAQIVFVQGSKIKVKRLKIYQHFIKYSKHKVIDIRNALAQQTSHPLIQQSGYKLIKAGSVIELYGDDQDFFSKIKRYVIQKDFDEKFKTIKKLGQTNSDSLYRVKNKTTGHDNAAKIINKHKLSSLQVKALRKEIDILQSVNHENLISLEEIYENQDQFIMVFELLRGGSLHDIYQDSLMSEEDAKLMIKSILKGLYYLQSLKIMHRDIKPTNILFRYPNNLESLVLIDFGLAEYTNTEQKYLFIRCGTPGFVAPEILQDKEYDAKVDIYPIGIILTTLLTGQSPFEGYTYEEIVTNNYFGKVQLQKSQYSPECFDFIQQCLCINPIIRMSVYQAMEHSFLGSKVLKKILIQKQSKQFIQLPQVGQSPNTTRSSNSRSPVMFRSPMMLRSPSQKLTPIGLRKYLSKPQQLYQLNH